MLPTLLANHLGAFVYVTALALSIFAAVEIGEGAYDAERKYVREQIRRQHR